MVTTPELEAYDGVILAVAHDSYREAGAAALRCYGRPRHVFCDLKSVFARDESDLRTMIERRRANFLSILEKKNCNA